MKKLPVITILLISACAPKTPHRAPLLPNSSGVMSLIGAESFGHACPVDGKILSARHVVLHKGKPGFYAWEDGAGSSGYLRSGPAMYRDLGQFYLLSGNPAYYSHSESPPEPGEEVSWQEYDLSDKKDAFAPRVGRAKVLRLVAGHIVLDPIGSPPSPGASGTCLFNTSGEVIGIVTWTVGVGMGDYVGFAASVYGVWWPGESGGVYESLPFEIAEP